MARQINRLSRTARRAVVIAALALALGACGGLPFQDQRRLGAAEQQQLNSSLRVAAAAADAGQVEAAKRLYTELVRHFPDTPEPRLGLAYLALDAGDLTLAGRLFAEADQRSRTAAVKAEALLGAGRVSLGRNDTTAAKTYFLAASHLAKGTPAEVWVANGLGVVATIEGDPARARTHYDAALKLSPSHPMITANLVRVLAQSGEEDAARRLYARYPASHWLDGDGPALSRLLDRARAARSTAVAEAVEPKAIDPKAVDSRGLASTGVDSETVDAETVAQASGPRWSTDPPRAAAGAPASGAKVQLYSSRSRGGALAAWGRLAAAEKDLLGTLDHRVVKVEFPQRGTFYRLRAGPLADRDEARLLCRLLKGRGRDCIVLAGKWSGGAGGGARPATAARSADARTGGAAGTAAPAGDEAGAAAGGAGTDAATAGTAAGSATGGAKVQLYASRTRRAALAAWGRLTAAEKDLLGSLSHRVVKVEIPKRGTFYRLRAGPLADRAAATRLCGRLKGRGRDCLVLAGQWTGGAGTEAAASAEGALATAAQDEAGTGTAAAGAGAAVVAGSATEGAKVQLYASRTRRAALAAWGRLTAEEKDLLGSLDHRVVKVRIPKRGVFYRLRAGPLADRAAATRLCGRLKGRGRDCLVLAGQWTGGAGPGAAPETAAQSVGAGAGTGTGKAGAQPQAGTTAPPERDDAGTTASAEGAAASAERDDASAAAGAAGTAAAGAVAGSAPGSATGGAKVQLYASRTRGAALAAWGRLTAEEKDLLGSLSHRVVKVEIPKRGAFYRLRAGPLPDKAAARRLCSLLKGRGRDCLVLAGQWTGGATGPAGARQRAGTAAATARDETAAVGSAEEGIATAERAEARAAAGAAGADAAVGGAATGTTAEEDIATAERVEAREVAGAAGAAAAVGGAATATTAEEDIATAERVEAREAAGAAATAGAGTTTAAAGTTTTGAGTTTAGAGIAAAGAGTATAAAGATTAGAGATTAGAGATTAAVGAAAAVDEAGGGWPRSGARVQLYSGRSRAEALAVWGRLSAQEAELLGTLAPRVVRVEIPGRGVFYRLRAGPLADTAAARRLCGRLRSRGRDCFVPAAP